VSSAETRRAFNSEFDTVNLHRPTDVGREVSGMLLSFSTNAFFFTVAVDQGFHTRSLSSNLAAVSV
jgi:hypothetical protein